MASMRSGFFLPGHRMLGNSLGSWEWVWSDEREREMGLRGGRPLKRMILEARRKEKGTPGGVHGHREAEALGTQGSAHTPYEAACLNVHSGSMGLGCSSGIANSARPVHAAADTHHT